MNTDRFQPAQLIIVALVMVIVCLHASAGITTVSLRSTVRILGTDPITLGQIGTIEGDQSAALSAIAIGELPIDTDDGWDTIQMNDLRDLIEQTPGVHAGSVVIEGSSVSIRRMGTQTKTIGALHEPESAEVRDGPVVRDHVERWVRDRYRIGNDLMRLDFRKHDDAFLTISTLDRLVEIREISKRGRTAIRVIVLDNLEVAAEQALVFDVEIFREVLVATRRANRGVVLDSSMIMVERRWVLPDDETASHEEAVGMSLSKTINAGQLIGTQHIELPLVIRRGDIVSAKSISGSVVVTVRGRAKADARLGETVEIESMNGQNQFRAKATGAGRAVILKERTNS